MWLSSLKVERRTCCGSTAQDDANVVCQTGADKWHFAWFLRFLSLSWSRCVCVTGFVQHSSSLLISCRTVNLNNPRRLLTCVRTCCSVLMTAGISELSVALSAEVFRVHLCLPALWYLSLISPHSRGAHGSSWIFAPLANHWWRILMKRFIFVLMLSCSVRQTGLGRFTGSDAQHLVGFTQLKLGEF